MERNLERSDDAKSVIEAAHEYVIFRPNKNHNLYDNARRNPSLKVYCALEEAEAEVDYFREYYGVSGYALDPDFMQSENVPAIIKDYCQDRFSRLLDELASKQDWYRVKHISGFLGDFSVIMDHIDEYGVCMRSEESEGALRHYDLLETAIKRGTGRMINRVLNQYFCSVDDNSVWVDIVDDVVRENGELGEINDRTADSLGVYAAANGIEVKNGFNSLHVNTAMEISRSDYDLIVGIYRGCTSLTTPLEVIGDNVRYINYSRLRNPNRDAEWLPVGRVRQVPEKAEKILVCEDDAVTGGSLKKAVPLLEKLDPKQVDVCFTGFDLVRSVGEVKKIPFYNKAWGLWNIFDRYVGNIRKFDARLKRLLRKGKNGF